MSRKNTNIMRPLAPEEIERGIFVAVLRQIEEYLPCCFDASLPRDAPVRIEWLPDDPEVLEVIEVSLPYVFARNAKGSVETLDVRRHTLGRLSGACALRVLESERKCQG